MVAVVQKKAFKPGRYRGELYTADRLRQFAEGTNKALAVKIPIPALKRHAPLAADDKKTEEFAATDGAGWLTKLEAEEDGSLTPHFDVPDEIAKGISDGTIRFTSPEFRNNYQAADGRYSGPITRHWSFTPLPKAHDQGQLAVAMSEGVYQFSEDDFPPKKEREDCSDEDGDGEKKTDVADPPSKPVNPDLPPNPTDESKAEALRACLSQLGAELTSDWTLEKPGAVDELLACLKTLAKAKQEADSNNKADSEPPETEEAAMPFSETDIDSLPAPMQVKARKANADAKAAHDKAVQFSEERKSTAREKAVAALKTLRLPPGLKAKWLEQLGTTQFSEAGELPTLTIIQAAATVADSLPAEMSFAEADLQESDHPEGDSFFIGGDAQLTAEQAEAHARRIHSRGKVAAAK